MGNCHPLPAPWFPIPTGPWSTAYLEDPTLAADVRRLVLILRLDGFGAVDHVGALDHELGCSLHRDELETRG